jgi:hypothetical protein
MIRHISKLIAALTISASSLFAAAPAVLADDVSTTGPDSSVTVTANNQTTVTNDNNVTVTNTNYQSSSSGSATVSNNTTGGSATSGNASNSNTTVTGLAINNINSMPSGGSENNVSTTGPNSPVYINSYSKTTITNDNNVTVNNYNHQAAYTGKAKVSNNTTGGSATSGNAGNSNCTSTSITINNGGGMSAAANNACGQNNGGQGGGSNNSGGQQGGSVLAAMTTASVGGQGAGGLGAAQLPNTGARDSISPWVAVTILTILGSTVYWRLVISPKLKTL